MQSDIRTSINTVLPNSSLRKKVPSHPSSSPHWLTQQKKAKLHLYPKDSLFSMYLIFLFQQCLLPCCVKKKNVSVTTHCPLSYIKHFFPPENTDLQSSWHAAITLIILLTAKMSCILHITTSHSLALEPHPPHVSIPNNSVQQRNMTPLPPPLTAFLTHSRRSGW